jgi:hypothetical protein
MITLLIFLAANVANGGETQRCPIIGGELVPSAQIAREIAEAIIRSRETSEQSSQYELRVEPSGNDAWHVFQAIPDRIEPNGTISTTDGGGGLAMRIDRCNGAISNVNYLI